MRWILLLALLGVSGCTGDREARALTAALQKRLADVEASSTTPKAVWKSVRDLYELRDHAPVWVERSDTSKAAVAIAVLRSAPHHGLTPDDYKTETLAGQVDAVATWIDSADWPQQLADLDIRLSAAVLSLGSDVAIGRTNPTRIDARWKRRRDPPHFALTLARAADAGRVDAWLNEIRPRHPEYAALQTASLALDGREDVEAARLARIAINMERWRWLPDELGARHLLVNIPQFTLLAREDGAPVMDIRVVVGKPEHKTPVFSAAMNTVVFSPYWHIPDSIVENETGPAVARDPEYLRRHGIEILRTSRFGAQPVDPSDVDWDNPDELRQLAFRQKPGARNALGHVKFLFPNPFDVYLHDTPAGSLFDRPGRAFSHGCVRVEEPEALAIYILRGYDEWNDARIRSAMQSGVESPVKLRETIPVHIVYFTAWVDEQGQIHEHDDVYGYDAKSRTSTAISDRLATIARLQ